MLRDLALILFMFLYIQLNHTPNIGVDAFHSIDGNSAQREEKKYFYIYEWPKEFGDVYPQLNAHLDNETVYNHSFNANSGAGKLLHSGLGLFQTWQFSLFKNVMSRLVVSKFRTRDPTLASIFIIPFDAGVHSYIDHKNGRRRLASPHGWDVINMLQKAQSDKSIFWKHSGHDHFVIFSLTEFVMTGIAVKEFFMGICQNCSVLTVESTPTLTSTLYHKTRKYWIPVPYPSAFHFHENIVTLPWSYTPHRDILSLFIGSTFTMNVAANAFRKILKSHCDTHQSCHWYDVKHSCNAVVNASDIMLEYRRAKFCLCPPGDTITRKSLFDALTSGCVPVIFAKASLSQYFWHLTRDDIESISVFLSVREVSSKKFNFLKILERISPQLLLQKQLAIAKVAPRLQYSVVPLHIRSRVNISREGHGTYGEDDASVVWDPAQPDAVDIIIQRMLNRSSIKPLEGFSDEELRMHKCLQHSIVQMHSDYGGLFKGGTKHLAAPKLYKKLQCENFTIPQDIFEHFHI